MTRVAICTPDIASGDAVSNDVLGMYEAFGRSGLEAAVFGCKSFIKRPKMRPAEQMIDFLAHPDDLLVYHHSVGWDAGLKILKSVACRKVIKYHNVTPPSFFAGLGDHYLVACAAGRDQLRDIGALGADLYLADSQYNLNEMIRVGPETAPFEVVPPFHHIDRLGQIEPDQRVLGAYRDGKVNILMVGRIVPNKGHLDLIDAFCVYQREHNPASRLLLVGKIDPGLKKYNAALAARIRTHGLDDYVFLTDGVSDAELKAYYLAADVFAITSLHEGFCVPLVEAMSMNIPIVAYASSAIPGTAGGAGIVWEERDPALLAASIDVIARNPETRNSLCTLGQQRYQKEYTNASIEERFLTILKRHGILRAREKIT